VTALPAFAPAEKRGSTPSFPRMSFRIEDVPALPPGVDSPADLQGEWVIARTKGNYERKLVWMLETICPGIGWCLPMEHLKRKSSGQPYTRLVFSSYVFVCCGWEGRGRYELRQRENVFDIIPVTNQALLVSELKSFHIAAENGLLKDRRQDIRPGIKCIVKQGRPFEGCVGYIDARDDKKGEVVLMMTMLGDSRPTTIPLEDVEPI
jgi:transcription antitermination factor NusG